MPLTPTLHDPLIQQLASVQGHQVSLPEESNNPGYDLLVDGTQFQVKCLSNLSGIRDHFEKYPDTPVFANSDLAQLLEGSGAAWADKVFFVEGYDYEIADRIMDASLEAGASLDDLNVPVFAIAVSAAKNFHGWWKGSVSLSDVPFEVAVDGAIKGGLAISGGFAGQALGLLLFGPAGAIVFGGVGGVGALFGSGWIRRRFDSLLAKGWSEEVSNANARFRSELRRALVQKLELARGKANALQGRTNEETDWLKLKLWDEALAIAESIHSLDTKFEDDDPPQQARRYLTVMHESGVHPWTVNAELKELLSMLESRPRAKDTVDEAITRTGRIFQRWSRPSEREL